MNRKTELIHQKYSILLAFRTSNNLWTKFTRNHKFSTRNVLVTHQLFGLHRPMRTIFVEWAIYENVLN